MLGTNRLLLMVGVGVLAVAGCATEDTSTSALGQEGRVVTVLDGNPGCAEAAALLGRDLGTYEAKIDPPAPGTYVLDAYNSVTLASADGVYLDWWATLGIDAVIVKGGDAANVYVYDPEAFADSGLSSPVNASGQPAAISHVTFCYDYNVLVSKTAVPSFNRTYAWSIDKVGAEDALTLAAGEVYPMAYTVAVARSGAVDSDWQVAGDITIGNPTPFEAHVVAVTDELGALSVVLDCPGLPATIAPGGAITCTYEVALPGPEAGTNHVVVETVGDVGGGEASATFDVATAAPHEYDACIAVSDDRAGALGTACEARTFAYTLDIGPYAACGASEAFVNTASFVAADSGATGADAWTVAVTVPPCEVGCTLTQGYWKTHAGDRSPPFDDAWLALPAGPATPFYTSGASYEEVLWTPPKGGNAYYVLAHQYIAAVLNGANGASVGAVAAALDEAHAIFAQYTPADIAALRKGAALPVRMLKLAGVLDRYNNGLIGPGHCDEPVMTST